MGKKKRKRDRSLSCESEDKQKKKKVKSSKKRKKEKKEKRRRSPSSCSTASSSSVASSDGKEKRKSRKRKKKHDKKKIVDAIETKEMDEVMVGPSVPADLVKTEPERPKMAPMTKEEWDKRQSVVRRVYDEASGRHRLIKGSGEVIEEIVSRDRHREINRQATAGDGMYFQSKLPQR